MSNQHDVELMQYVDGELAAKNGEPDAGVMSWDAGKLEGLGQLTELVSGHLELTADAIPDRKFDAMWRNVTRAMDAAAPVGWRARFSAWFDGHRSHVITGISCAGTVALLALLLNDPPAAERTTVGGSRSTFIDVQPAAQRSVPIIEDLETYGGGGTLLNITDEDGHMMVIVVTPEDRVGEL